MAKTYLSTVKYEVKAKYDITGLVEKPDIVGAIFGQSEGLLGEDMDLKQLQQNGKIGRIEITVNKGKGTTTGEITIPSSLDQVKTSILAATMETVEKVGPCEANVTVTKISDVRKEKRGQITDRAKELLKKMQKFEGVESDVMADDIRSNIRTEKAVKYKGMTAGPDVELSKNIIVVEGRADVLRLLSYGIKDAIEMNGSNISKELIQLCKEKEVTVLIDGDRGGELNIKKLNSLTNVNYVARAPDGKEVEELTQKEILQALKRRLEVADFLGGKTSTRRESHTRNDSRGRYNSNDRRGRNDSYQRNDRNDSRGRHDRNDSFGRNDRRGRNDSYQRNDRN
ncbi:MAG: DNA primase, partial [Candidatus Diapherotrites archaeon]|nr:DNA primase [Candidatus Diapherotrites archaeon]